ncbi:MAG: hypothetical protein M3Y39_17685 [Chloroflexota bacterium]|nr:hypothetical protein [Chloroflexota bacterium]
MAKRKRAQPPLEQQQPYDNLLKSLLEGQEAQILPHILDGAVYQETYDIEIMRTILRADRVYKVLYKGKEHILHLEFETGADEEMSVRLLDYHAYLYRKYRLPVISVIVYPFETTMATSPLQEESDGELLLLFHFRRFPLWYLQAEKYVQEHSVALYALLPAMAGANAQVILPAIDEMVEYYKDDENALAREIRWIGIVLRRSTIVPEEDKRMIEERLSMYDDLMEKDPKMRKIRAESEARGEAKGAIKTLRMTILLLVKGRFPALLEQAQQRVKRTTSVDELKQLFEQLTSASDEAAARALLL